MKKKKLIILGSGGFISSYVEKNLYKKNKKFIAYKRLEFDLTKISHLNKLKKKITSEDIIFFIAAKAPVKNLHMFNENIKMIVNFCRIFDNQSIKKIVYLSSDAVYSDSKKMLNEKSLKEPNNWHGLMHITREQIIKNNFPKKKVLILRPTLVYGKNDPHNGYGPNKFLRDAKQKKRISIFGKGEELRDHIWVQDLSNIISKLIYSNQFGDFNLTTGKLISFYSIAKLIKNKKENVKIINLKRQGKMPHNGYRPLSNNKIKKLFPTYKFKTLAEVINKL